MPGEIKDPLLDKCLICHGFKEWWYLSVELTNCGIIIIPDNQVLHVNTKEEDLY